MYQRTAAFAALFLFVLTTAAAHAERATECFDEKGFTYCVTADKDKSDTYVYMLHGLGQSAKTWGTPLLTGALLEEQWAEKAPTVINVSFGPTWLLAQKNGQKDSGLLEVFVGGVLPAIEKKHGVPKHRRLLGESMGAFNALQLALKQGKLFERVAVICPPVVTPSPYDADAIEKFIKETKANALLVKGAIALVRNFYETKDDYAKASPLALIETVDPKELPELYVSCGSKDDYGFFPGTKQFVKQAKERKIGVQWHPLLGTHCAMDAVSTAEFLTR